MQLMTENHKNFERGIKTRMAVELADEQNMEQMFVNFKKIKKNQIHKAKYKFGAFQRIDFPPEKYKKLPNMVKK